ncbi:hypothetical protein [Paenibacillus sp. Leaf72]|uniref:hypothetical protein n=1 Tax=Paenibacillus sp. Leaf72 TaxID=1736234 RepID=UPI0006FDA81E|nr:hypothetical protein [Paenibacillus sp. Leaf72]KQO18473.1 hypothetical protein ASF12_07655 [Paenibacillus sp. Leaf72]
MSRLQLFVMQADVGGISRSKAFLEDNFVCLYGPGLGNLEPFDEEACKARLIEADALEGAALVSRIVELRLFVEVMADGDYVLLVDGDKVHFGDLGDYYYVLDADNREDGSCHRRGVTWLKSLPQAMAAPELKSFIAEGQFPAMYEHPVTDWQMELWLSGAGESGGQSEQTFAIDHATIREAVDILRLAMQSEDVERRERAAAAILQYASRSRSL